MKQSKKKKDVRKPVKASAKTTKRGRVELHEEELSGVSGGVQKIREAADAVGSGGDRPSES
jgi:hypothetical protein